MRADSTLSRLRSNRQHFEDVGRRFGISAIRVFGSVARGTATDRSDLDLLVRIEPGRTLLDLIGFEQTLEDELGIDVDVVDELALHPMMKDTVLAEALLL